MKNKGVRRLLCAAICSAGLFFMMIYILQIAIPVAHRIQLTVAVERPDTLQVFYRNSVWVTGFTEQRSVRSELISSLNKPTTVNFNLKDVSVERLRIDPGNYPGKVRLYELKIFDHYSKPKAYKADDLYRILEPGTDKVSLQLKGDYLEIDSATDDPILLVQGRLLTANPVLLYGLPFLFAAIFFFKVNREGASFLSISPPKIHEKKDGNGERVSSLDGLRGMAVIMVVGEHSCGYLAGLGAGGVWIFMALSGFLVAKQYINNPRLALDQVYAVKFYSRRLSRITPVYYLYIAFIYLSNVKFNEAVRHLFFLQADGHLWFIPQIMLFYLVFPLLMVILYISFRGDGRPATPFLLLTVICANIFMTSDLFSLYGMNNQHYRFFLGTFLGGTFFSYLHHLLFHLSSVTDNMQKRIRKICAAAVWAILLTFIFLFSDRLWGEGRVFTREFFPSSVLLPVRWSFVSPGLVTVSSTAC